MSLNYQTMESQLSGSYREVFAKTALYACTKNIATEESDERMADLYELLLTAQEEKKPVEKLVGKDIEKFCKDYFEDYTWKERLKLIPKDLFRMSVILLVLELFELWAAKGTADSVFSIQTDPSGYLFGLGIGVFFTMLCNTVFSPLVLKSKKIKPGVWYFLMLLALVLLFIGGMTLASSVEMSVPVMALILISGGYAALYLIVRSIWRYRNFGTIRNTRKQLAQDSYYKNLQDKDLENAYLEGLQMRWKRYERKKKMTAEEFLPFMLKEEKLMEKTEWIYTAIAVVIGLCSIIGVAMDGSGVLDVLTFTLFISVVEFVIWRAIIRSDRKGAALRRRIFKECEDSGKTLPDYIDSRITEYKAAKNV